MKYVDFKRVEIKNFLSVGESPVVIEFNKGLNIITGNNKDKLDRRNGVGKSTVADSVYFAIFGSTLRELKKDHIVNNITQRNCAIELDFALNTDGVISEYKITRRLSPTKCNLYKDGEDITRDTIQNTTQYVQELLNTTPEVFQNCVIMTINNTVPFMAKKKLEKRKFIEGIFNLQVFSNMLTDVRSEYNKVNKDLDIECARYEEISNTLSNQQKQQSDAEQDIIRNKQKLVLRKANCEKDIKSIELEIDDVPPINTDDITEKINKIDSIIPKAEAKMQELIGTESKLSAMVEVNKTKRSKISDEHTTCPTCLHKLDDEHKHLIKEEKERISDQIVTYQEARKKVTKELKESVELKSKLTTGRRELTNKLQQAQIERHKHKNLRDQLSNLRSQMSDIDDDIKSVDKNSVSFDKMLSDTSDRLDKTQVDIDQIKTELAKLEIIKFIVSEEGVKSYIVKKILQLFNSKLAYYLKRMDSNCICVFNEYFEDEIVDEKGKPCSYFNFSGAERKNIDLACLFAFMDIRRLQGDVAFNFSMYDELFDSSLDERGVELVIEILKERIDSFNECIMVISHRKESTKLATGEVIFLEKQNGVTTRVETPESELK
jgi:DNA repair exonuclease SbcCD ATPase subunit